MCGLLGDGGAVRMRTACSAAAVAKLLQGRRWRRGSPPCRWARPSWSRAACQQLAVVDASYKLAPNPKGSGRPIPSTRRVACNG
ncbi:hypothetical protein DAI22_04g300300 [Oryza sativa Japonica Group]|nr:hypothetical protein DAI22_04g300300 [Oryza sativa Japonica Group]